MKFDRHLELSKQILFVDGLTGTGKTMMTPILGSLERVQLCRLDFFYEQMCITDFLGKIEPDAAEALIRMHADQALYDNMIARETNFRWHDLSGALRNPDGLEYLRRLFAEDGRSVAPRIKSESPILHVSLHQAFSAINLAFRAFGQRLAVIEMIRHPVYLLEHWHSYIDRHGTDSQDFTIWLQHKEAHLPWFAHSWEDKYLSSSSMDRVIYTIEWLTKHVREQLKTLSTDLKKNVLFIPFEHFVLQPDPFMKNICNLLQTTTTPKTNKVLKKQNCPRKLLGQGRSQKAYKRYAWTPPSSQSTERKEFEKKWKHAESLASKDAMTTLAKISEEYQKEYSLDDTFRP